jgi:hypothetical protein
VACKAQALNQDTLMTFKKTLWTTLLASTLSLAALSAHAETKKELVQRLLVIQQASLDSTARGLVETPARQLVMAAQPILAQGVPADKREATAKALDVEIKKYMDSALPVVRMITKKDSETVVGPMFEEKFTEDELRQLVTMLESPVLKKYQTMLPDLSKALIDKVVEDARPQVDPKLQAVQEAVRKILDTATGGKLSQAAAAHQQEQQKGASTPAAKPKGK